MKLVATSVVRGSHQGGGHGGVYLIDLEAREVRQLLDWNTAKIAWQGGGDDRGLRSVAFDGQAVYLAADDELFAYTPDFRPIGSWHNVYLKHCEALAIWERRLFMVSAGCDSILGFDLDRKEFSWAMQVVTRQSRFLGRAFDPRKEDGPLMLNKLHLNNVHCTRGGLYLTGLKTGGMLLFNGREILMAVELPPGTHNARPFRDGVVFNDTGAGALRYSGRGEGTEDRSMRMPQFPAESLQGWDMEKGGIARPGFARGLAVLSDSLVAGGSSPSTVSVYDLPGNERVLSVNLSMDVRDTIHSLAVWPFA